MGASDKEALGIAFAIASKHKREGMPTRASARFSQTGKRTGFIEVALLSKEQEIEQVIRNGMQILWDTQIRSFFQSVLNR
jgi:hypothetical protein